MWGLKSNMPSITDAFQNLYNYLISISGVVALVALIVGGVIYLTSAGDPEKLGKAKKQILAALLGIVLLLSSYLILRTINPELVTIELPQLKPATISPSDLPPGQARSPILFDKVKLIVDEVGKASQYIENSSQEIKNLTDNCDCSNTQPLCQCSGGGQSDTCNPLMCYTGPGFQPCPDEREIKENQKNIIAWKEEILYYRNRALEEVKDLEDEIKKVLDEKIFYYQKNIIVEEDEQVKQYFEEEKEKVTQEKNLKKNLGAKLQELAHLIEEIEPFISEIAILPDKCLYDEGVYGVNNKCQPSCKQGKEYGCHDAKEGCQPDECSGGNPCPVGEINDQFLLIQGLRPQIITKCNEILNIIEEIIELKTIIL